MDELDIPPGKLSESAQRIVDRAVEESRRRDHAVLGPEHLFLAFAQVEWDLFAEVMRELNLNPYAILQTLDDHLLAIPSAGGRDVHPSAAAKLVFKLALQHASRNGRHGHRFGRPLHRYFRGNTGRAGCVLRDQGVEPDLLVARISSRMRDVEIRDERSQEAIRAAAVPQALRDEPEPARPSGSHAAGLRPRP